MCVGVSVYAQNAKPAVIPEIREWNGKVGYFVPSENMSVVYGDESLKAVAEQFAADYKTMFGVEATVSAGKAAQGDFFFGIKKDKKLTAKEGYAVTVAKNVQVTANEPIGAFWATRTLLQIAEQSDNHQIPNGTIKDWPDYGMRGFMLDCGRKYIPMSYLKDLVKVMAYYKMNTLQIHLNDNGFPKYFENDWMQTYSAFRLESDTYPGLTARDGSYTKKEFREFQLESAAQFVNIIPEIDAPAHSLAFTQYRPDLGSEKYGLDHFDLTNPEVIPFMDALWKEYLEGDEPVFVGPDVHIGTDEYSNETPELVALFRSFTDHYIRFVEGYGKNAFAWGALSHADGPTPIKSENVTMAAWSNGFSSPKLMKELGYKIISIPDVQVYIVPIAWYYHDYLDSKNLYEVWTPANIAYNTYDYAEGVLFDEHDPAIVGSMFAVWNDHIGNGATVKDIHHRTMPALQVMSTKSWNIAPTLSFEEYNALAHRLSEAPGVNQLARIGKGPGVVYEAAQLKAGSKLPYKEIGFGYEVSFDIETAAEAPGTELFRTDDAVFYLSDPIGGKVGYATEGYLNTFNYNLLPGEKLNVRIAGDNMTTSLYINGKLVQTLGRKEMWFNGGKDYMRQSRALVFPLETAGNFNSKITKLRVVRSE